MPQENTLAVLERSIEKQKWLEPVDKALDRAGSILDADTPAARELSNCLHGTWLGHPLHPVLTDVPLGAWTAALAMDILDASDGRGRYARGSDAAVAVGLVGALGAAATGLADWRKTDGAPRKVGIVHGLLNVGVTALYAGSLGFRRAGHRGSGRALSFLGFAVSLFSAYLGGHLVYDERIGVDHAVEELPPDRFVNAMPAEELKEGEPRRVEIEGAPVMLVRLGRRVHALAETCAHLGGPLSEGEVRDGCVTCPWHGSTYSLEDGHVVTGPSAFPQPVFETRVRQGMIQVRGPRKPA